MARRRWTLEEKIRIVIESLNTNIGVAELYRKYAVTPSALLPLEREIHRGRYTGSNIFQEKLWDRGKI